MTSFGSLVVCAIGIANVVKAITTYVRAKEICERNKAKLESGLLGIPVHKSIWNGAATLTDPGSLCVNALYQMTIGGSLIAVAVFWYFYLYGMAILFALIATSFVIVGTWWRHKFRPMSRMQIAILVVAVLTVAAALIPPFVTGN